jgi:hypothetical protein
MHSGLVGRALSTLPERLCFQKQLTRLATRSACCTFCSRRRWLCLRHQRFFFFGNVVCLSCSFLGFFPSSFETGGAVFEAMPRYTTSQTFTDGNTQIVALPEAGGGGGGEAAGNGAGPLVAVSGGGAGSGAIVEYKGGEGAIKPLDDEDLEVKLRRISEQVPVRISNTSGSSAGSGSGDFHQV